MAVDFNQTLDVKGAKCPMPLVKSRKAVNDLAIGDVCRLFRRIVVRWPIFRAGLRPPRMWS